MRHLIARSAGLAGLFLLMMPLWTQAADTARVYDIAYRVSVQPAAGTARVRLTLDQPDDFLREMRFDATRLEQVEGDGEVRVEDGQVTWRPPADGGRLQWHVPVLHERDDGEYDAWLDDQWGLFRAEDVIPRAATRTLKGAESRTRYRVVAPPGWSVITPYTGNDEGSRVSRPGRRFSQPTGWLVMGELGVRRERIAGVRVVIAAPEGHDVRRMDMLALLNWTLPELASLVPALPERVTIVSAGQPMWRGALSAPHSLYLHAERPLISGNATSTLLHELMHVALGLDARAGYDWLVEGLAEYYAMALLVRSGTVTRHRYRAALEDQAEWAASSDVLCGRSSAGATTARAVVLLADIDAALREATGDRNLDDVLVALLGAGAPLDRAALVDAIRSIGGESILGRLDVNRLPGCEKYPAGLGG